jgi:hypothetical protein
MFLRIVFAALAIVGVAPSAMALETMIGSVSVNLPPPGGFCDLSMNDASEKHMLTTVGDILTKAGNKLLGMSADCRQLADWRTGKRKLLDDFAQYQTSIAMLDKPPSETVAQSCGTLRAQGTKIASDQMPDAKRNIESTLKKVKYNEQTFVGVLAEDADACYAGLISKIRTEVGTDKTQLTLFAITIIKNRMVFVYRFTVYNSNTVNKTLANLKIDVAAMVAANRN